LFAASTDIIVAYTVKLFLVGTLDGLSLVKQHGVGGHNTELAGVHLNYLELYSLETSSHKERVALSHRSIAVLGVVAKTLLLF
jgi:hypothetical protein